MRELTEMDMRSVAGAEDDYDAECEYICGEMECEVTEEGVECELECEWDC